MASQRTSWNVQSSTMARSAHNPIRQIVDKLKLDPQATKSFISLSVGDPTIFGNFNIDDSANEAVIRQLKTFKHNGYPPAHGN
jgi:tyrosine aminotransferase